MAAGATFTTRFGSLLTVIGKVSASLLTPFLSGFAGFFTIVGETAWIVNYGISHFSIFSVLAWHQWQVKVRGGGRAECSD